MSELQFNNNFIGVGN